MLNFFYLISHFRILGCFIGFMNFLMPRNTTNLCILILNSNSYGSLFDFLFNGQNVVESWVNVIFPEVSCFPSLDVSFLKLLCLEEKNFNFLKILISTRQLNSEAGVRAKIRSVFLALFKAVRTIICLPAKI